MSHRSTKLFSAEHNDQAHLVDMTLVVEYSFEKLITYSYSFEIMKLYTYESHMVVMHQLID